MSLLKIAVEKLPDPSQKIEFGKKKFSLHCIVSASNLSFFFFSFAGDYTGRPAVVMNEAVLHRSLMIPYSLL